MEGLHDSVEFILKILSEEARIVTPDRVIVLGLSQGFATGTPFKTDSLTLSLLMLTGNLRAGLLSLLATPMKIGAYVGLSGWMPLREQIAGCRKSTDFLTLVGLADTPLSRKREEEPMRATPIFLGHATDDDVVNVDLGRQTRDMLLKKGLKVTWWEQEAGGHWGLLKTWGLNSIIAFLDEIIKVNT